MKLDKMLVPLLMSWLTITTVIAFFGKVLINFRSLNTNRYSLCLNSFLNFTLSFCTLIFDFLFHDFSVYSLPSSLKLITFPFSLGTDFGTACGPAKSSGEMASRKVS